MNHKGTQSPHHGGGLRLLGWAAGALACLVAAAAVAALLPEPLLRHLPGEDGDWQYAALQLGDYLEAPVASAAEARRLTAESVVYNGRPAGFLSAMLDEDSFRREEIECLALNVYFEARGESDIGKRAVAHVVMNRVADPAFPSSVCAVIRQGGTLDPRKCQFTWWCDARSNRPVNRDAWRASRAVAAEVYDSTGDTVTGGALWYHADYVAPRWNFRMAQGPKIGRHIFYYKAPPGAPKGPLAGAGLQEAASAVPVIRPERTLPQRAPLPTGPLQRQRQITPIGPSEAALPQLSSGG